AHFVREVTRRGEPVYTEKLTQTSVGLDTEQIDELNWTLGKVDAARLSNGWDAAGKTGTWQAGTSLTDNAHPWMVAYTRARPAAAVPGSVTGATRAATASASPRRPRPAGDCTSLIGWQFA